METTKSSGPRACRPCAVSKARCLFPEDTTLTNGKCRRCNRLNKDCVKPPPVTSQPKASRTTRVARLEEKLDGLVSLMSASSQATVNPNISLQNPLESLTLSQSPNNSISTPLSIQSDHSPSIQSLKDIYRFDPDVLLGKYHLYYAQSFPFVVVPQGITYYELERKAPFLSKVVLMIAASDSDAGRTSVRVEDIFHQISARTVLHPERDLDLLQGLILFIAWNHIHIHINNRAPRTVTLLHLAMSVAIDLELNRESTESSNSFTPQGMMKAYSGQQLNPTVRTIEERRTYLGLVYLFSVVSVYLKPMDAIRVTPYMTACMQIVEDTAEYVSDQFIIHLLRLQLLGQEIRDTLPREELVVHSNSAPISMCIKVLQSKLESFKNKIPPSLQENHVLLMHYNAVLVYLTETAFFLPIASRTATLHACLLANHAFLNSLFSLPLTVYGTLSYATWVQLIYVLGVISNLSRLDNEDWDSSHVQGVVDLSLIIGALIARFESLEAMHDNQITVLKVTIPRLRKFQKDFELKKLDIMQKKMATFDVAHQIPINEDAPVQHQQWGHLDDRFWQEIMADGNSASFVAN